MAEGNPIFSEAILVSVSMLFKKAFLSLLAEGKAIDVFELGTLYPSAKGNIDGSAPSLSDVPDFTLGFIPSNEALHAVSKTEVVAALQEETKPQINTVEDFSRHVQDFKVTRGKPMRIKGERLKIDGEQGGLFLAPCDAEGTVNKDETEWIRIPDEALFRNTQNYVELDVPDSLAPGLYKIVIQTQSSRGGIVTKTVRKTIFEKAVEVV